MGIVKKTIIALIVLLMQGCTSANYGARIDRECPSPSKEHLKNGNLKLEHGVTLKCQVKNFTNRMSCIGIADGDDEGLLCNNGSKNAIFVFDKDGVLKNHKIY